jgi:Ca-activated chloride channel family protein
VSKTPTIPAGSPPAVDPALFGRQEAGLRTYLSGLHGASATQVDDVIKEVMRAAAEQPEFEDDPVVWFFAEGRRRMGHGGQRGEALVGDGPEEEAAAGEDPAIAIHRAFGRLTNKQQEMVRLKFQFGFNLAELARIAGVSQSGAGGLLHSAMERICRAAGAGLSLGESRGSDARLTAYALDEMEPGEKQSFVESVPDGKALLESSTAIRKVGQQLAQVLESGAPLPKRQRRRKGAAWWKSTGALLTGAGVILLAGLAWYFFRAADEAKPARNAAGSGVRGIGTTQTRAREGVAEANGRVGGGAEPADFAGRSGRALRPGEAAWERKPFGKGHGPTGSAAGAETGQVAGDAASPAESGGAESSLSASGGEKSAGTNYAPAERNDPAAENRGEAGESDQERDQAVAEPDASVARGQPEAEAASSEKQAEPASNPKSVPLGGTRPAKSAKQDTVAKTPADPKEASKIPDKRPALPGFTPMKTRLAQRHWPKAADVRIGEMLQRVPLERAAPGAATEPLTARLEITRSPWRSDKQIVRAVVRARPARAPARPPVNLVFAIDVSGSMAGPNRLPLVQEGIRLLAERLRPEDRVAVVTYAVQAKEILPGNPLGEKGVELRNCLTGLEASGQTNGYEGLQLAYAVARRNRVAVGLNVVVLCTDGNFNLGETNENALAAMAAEASTDGIKLSVFGFGRADRNDLRLEMLATQGGGRSCYVNTQEEAERLLSGQIDGLVEAVAHDVTLDVRFDPQQVTEVRRLDGGERAPVRELLSGRTLTALYEVSLKPGLTEDVRIATLDASYRLPGAPAGSHTTRAGYGRVQEWSQIDAGFRFAIAWAEFGRILQGDSTGAAGGLDRLEDWVQRVLPEDKGGYRRELLDNVAMARLAAGQ